MLHVANVDEKLSLFGINIAVFVYYQMSVKNEVLKYIATQGPVQNTIEDFWQMVIENKVAIIVMLTSIEVN